MIIKRQILTSLVILLTAVMLVVLGRHFMTNKSNSPEYQLVLEFHGDDLEHFDRVIALATKLEEELKSGEVDGHDVGGGIVNIFIDTSEPRKCFKDAMRIIGGLEPKPRAAGYRDFDEEDYVRLWPENSTTPFELK